MRMARNQFRSADEACAFFRQFGGTDFPYLAHHFPRFRATVDELCSGWSPDLGGRVLDVGAHWLHQTALLWSAGYTVTAVDLPATFETEWVKEAARRMDVDLVPVSNLADPVELGSLADDSFDLMLFSEIIEHITFNPVRFWSEIYRIVRPGGRIVVTTPNYYSPYSRAWDLRRFLRGFGGGIAVDEILSQNTYAHHWKEFSAGELIYYFARLSPDFNTVKARHFPSFDETPPRIGRLARLAYALKRRDPAQHANIYLEVEIARKDKGIVVVPGW